jgi:hypothetical protein
MAFKPWLQALRARLDRFATSPTRWSRSKKSLAHRPRLEQLEDRTLLSTITWANPQGGDWSVAGNWDLNRLPGPSDDVVINLSGITVTHSTGNDTIHSLTSTNPLMLSGGSLAISATSRIDDTLSVNGGTLALSGMTLNGIGTLTNASSSTLTLTNDTVNAGLANQGLLVAQGSSTFGGAFSNAAGATLRVLGGPSFGDAALAVAQGFTNAGAIELTSSFPYARAASLTVSGGVLTNAGSITTLGNAGGNGGRALAAQLDNQGTLTANDTGGSTALSLLGASTNSGTISVSGADLTVSGAAGASLTNSGTVTVSSGRTLTVNGVAFTQAQGGTLGGGGALAFNNDTVTLAVDTSDAAAALSFSGATVNGPGTLTSAGQLLTLTNDTVNAGLANQGLLVAQGSSTFGGAFSNAAGATLRVLGGLSFGDAALAVAQGLTNAGAIELTNAADGSARAASLTVSGGVLTNAGSITLGNAVNGDGRTLTAQLVNQGTLTASNNNGVAAALSLRGASTNSGTISASGTDLTVSGAAGASLTNNGTIAAAAGRTVSVSGVPFTQGGALGGGGALAFNNDTVTLAVDTSDAAAALSFSGATVNGPGTLTNAAGQTLTLTSDTVNAPLANQGLLVAQGSSTFGGAFSNAAGATLRVLGGPSFGDATLAVAQGLTNAGAIELTNAADGSARAASLTVSGGVLTNTNAGSITLGNAGGNGGRALAAQLDNQGTLTANDTGGSTTLQLLGASTNSGTISASGADLTVSGAAGASLTNSGTIRKSAGTGTSLINIPFSNTGTLDIENGTINLAGGFTNFSGTTLTGGTYLVKGTLQFNNASIRTNAANITLDGTSAAIVDQNGADALASLGLTQAYATSSYPGNPPDAAFDGNLQTWWSAGTYTGSITKEFPAPLTFDTVLLSTNASPTTSETYTIFGSSDGVTFTQLAQSTQTVVSGVVNTLAPISFPATTARYLRISVNGNLSWVGINEVGLMLAGTSIPSTALGSAVQPGSLTVENGRNFTAPGNYVNAGQLIVGSGSTFTINGSLIVDASGALITQPNTTLSVSGDLLGQTTNPNLFTPQGTVDLNGHGTAATPQQLEVMSQDQGAVAAGFSHNFAYGALALGGNNYVKLVDNFHNSPGTGPEALYVNALIVPSGSTLNLNGLHVYARSSQVNGTLTGGSLSLLPAGPIDWNMCYLR